MAAFSRWQFIGSRISSPPAPAGLTPRVVRVRTFDLREVALRVRGAVCETLMFVWGLVVVAVVLLIAAGFFL
jgi:hypothetical protein